MDHEDDASQYADCVSPGDLPLLALTPFTTNAPIAWDELETSLKEESPYRLFVGHLADTNKKLNSTKWGGIPAVAVLKGFLEKRFDVLFRNRGDGKLLPMYSLPIAEYITAHRFLDHLARVEGSAQVSRDVLKQPARDGLVGQQIHLSCLDDLGTLLREFISAADLCRSLLSPNVAQPAPSPGPCGNGSFLGAELQTASTGGISAESIALSQQSTEPLFSIAAELNGTKIGKKAMKIIRNLGAVAFSVRLLMQGSCLSVPDSYNDILSLLLPGARPQTPFEVKQLQETMKDPRGLRQAFRLAFLISPLLALSSSRHLEKYSACPSETLMNNKLLGNCKPLAIEEWEDQVLREVLRIAEGKQTAVQTLIKLADSWRQRPPPLTPEETHYFGRILSKSGVKYDKNMSLLDTLAISPHPTAWPLTPLVRSYIGSSGIEEASNSTQQSTATPNSPENPLASGATTPTADASRSASLAPVDNTGAPGDDEQTVEDPASGSEPRRSNRDRKPPAQPTEKPAWVKNGGSKGRKRQHETDVEGSGDGGSDDEEEEEPIFEPRKVHTLNIRSVHAKSVKKRKEILQESVIKMEEVEPSTMNLDVDEETPRLVIGEPVERYSDNEHFEFAAWDGDGNTENLKLECHLQEDFDTWKFILGKVDEQLCPSGRPRFLDDPDNSVLRICRPGSYNRGNTRELQRTYGRQSILVPGFSNLRADWKLEELEYAGDPEQETSMQDFSVSVVSGNYNDRVRTGNLKLLYNVSVSPPNIRKSLSALYFPQPNNSIDTSDPLATDTKAWVRTKSEIHCSKQLPTGDMRWAIVGTAGAMHYFHVDPRGDGTFILVRVGLKAWLLAMPIDENVLLSAELWTKMELDITKLDFTKWKVELILLRPGDLLIQLPHVSHAVYTPKHAICSGGHLIAMAALRRSLVGVIHTFFCKEIINIDHPSFACRLNSIVCFLYKTLTSERVSESDAAHLPDIYSVSGVEDLLLLTCVIELQNAVCPLSYQPTTDQTLLALLHQAGHTAESALENFDISAMSHEMRAQNVFSRGRMQATLQSVFRSITIFTDEGEMRDPWSQLFIPVLAHFIECLKTYHNLAFGHLMKAKKGKKKGKDSELPIPRERFLLQLRSTTFRWDPVLKVAVKNLANSKKHITTLLPPDLHFRVEKKAVPSNFDTPGTAPDFRELGMRTLDGLYFTFYNDLVTIRTGDPKNKAGDLDPTAAGTDSTGSTPSRNPKRRRVDGAQ